MQSEERLHSELLSRSASRLQRALEAARMVAWEFEVATGKMEYSGNLNSIFGDNPDAAGNTILAFDDRALVAELLEHAALGAGPYSSEFRLVGPDGVVIWIRNQGETVHDSEGQPSRVVGITLDITERKEAEELLHNIAAGVSVATGDAFFRLLTQHLCEALKTDFACIGELDIKHPEKVRTVAVFSGDRFWDELEYELANTPCQQALALGHCSYPHGVQSAFPLDHLLSEVGIESYLGVALIGSVGQPLGVMSVMNRSPLRNIKAAETILNIFASRAAAELERRRWEGALRESEVTNRAIVRALPDLVLVSNNNGTILELYAKDPTEFGFSQQSFPGKLEDVLGPEAAHRVLASTTSDSGEPNVVEYFLAGPAQHRFYEARAISFGDERILTIIRNITSKKRAETESEESRRFAQRIAETSLNVLFIYDLIERRNVYANERSADVIGYTPKEIENMGESFIELLMHPDDFALLPKLAAEYATRKDGEVFEHMFRLRHKNGQWRWVHRCATIFTRTADGRPKQILGSVTDITEYKRAEQELQELSARLLSVADDERRRIARELHDVTGQNLAAISFNLASLEHAIALPANVRTMLADCKTLCQESLEEIRTLSYLLHPPTLDKFGLVGAVEWYVRGFIERTGIDVTLGIKKDIGRLPPEMEMNLFRVVQEGLTNISRHSGSDTAIIRLDKQETRLILQIEDRRKGFREKAGPRKHGDTGAGVGIPAMRERLRQHGGYLEIRSDNTGTTLTAVVPLIPHAAPLKKSSQAGEP
jgi:PAS domain S-box-containing protein